MKRALENSIATIKAKTKIAKTETESALTRVSKEVLESENPNFITINHYKKTVEQSLDDLEEINL